MDQGRGRPSNLNDLMLTLSGSKEIWIKIIAMWNFLAKDSLRDIRKEPAYREQTFTQLDIPVPRLDGTAGLEDIAWKGSLFIASQDSNVTNDVLTIPRLMCGIGHLVFFECQKTHTIEDFLAAIPRSNLTPAIPNLWGSFGGPADGPFKFFGFPGSVHMINKDASNWYNAAIAAASTFMTLVNAMDDKTSNGKPTLPKVFPDGRDNLEYRIGTHKAILNSICPFKDTVEQWVIAGRGLYDRKVKKFDAIADSGELEPYLTPVSDSKFVQTMAGLNKWGMTSTTAPSNSQGVQASSTYYAQANTSNQILSKQEQLKKDAEALLEGYREKQESAAERARLNNSQQPNNTSPSDSDSPDVVENPNLDPKWRL
jgi:hypothetical protein